MSSSSRVGMSSPTTAAARRLCCRRRRRRRPSGTGGGLADLPEPLLVEILSALPPRDAVRTAVLSRRWRGLWRLVRAVRLAADAVRGGRRAPDLAFWGEVAGQYRRFVAGLVGEAGLERLRVEFACPHHYKDVMDELVRFGVGRGVAELSLDFTDGWSETQRYKVPVLAFQCEKITVLELGNCDIQVPDSIRLPHLKMLKLSSCRFDGVLLESLVSGCPVLECLSVLHCCVAGGVVVRDGGMMSLRSLRVKCSAADLGSGDGVVVDAPGLRVLELGGCMRKGMYLLKNLGSVREVCLGFYVCQDCGDMVDILKDLPHVSSVKLRLNGTKVHKTKAGLPWQSMNITCLELVTSLTTPEEIESLGCLLVSFPQMEILKFKFAYANDCLIKGQECWNPLQHCFSSFLQLKTVIIYGFVLQAYISRSYSDYSRFEAEAILKDCENQFELVRILLSSSKTLEKLVVVTEDVLSSFKGLGKLLARLYNKLLGFPRASPAAEIVIR